MRKLIIPVITLFVIHITPVLAQSQQRNKKPVRPAAATPAPPQARAKRYPSLLWEISGNGLKKPSFLFGTMHVSDKLAFHLGDSFYNAIKSADVVALETNPETWQDDFTNSIFFRRGNSRSARSSEYGSRRSAWPGDLMRITTFAIDSYDESIKAALAVEPSMVNGMLYRTYGTHVDDFEEDTFLDMYIFQVGKKLGKKVDGVENFEESEKLVMEAYRDMLRDRNRKKRSYDYEGMITNPKKVEDAYRKGDLDMLDSLESLTVFSDAFQEKFLYKRNEIQANSIDSIVKKASLFVGVGAAHLPGRRGVIELLRRKGYTMRPVLMDDRNSQQKESVDKIRANYSFVTQTSADGFYKVAVPGKKLYRFTEWNGMDVMQYADMVNGAYYVVTRIKTNSLLWGHSSDLVYKKIDSLLYENIPGKILKKTPITKDGYRGMDILNRTRRGDYQRYQLFITPFEIIVFKMSGNGDYVDGGPEAQQFFGSIKLQQYQSSGWVGWHPKEGGFTIQMPHEPSMLRDNNFGTDRLEFAASDNQDGNSYLVMKVDLHNYSFIEEDTFDLNLMDESYGFSTFIDKQLSRKFTSVNGYPALESKYRNKDGSYSEAKYVIQGPVYYVLVARYRQDNANVHRFMESFAITPFIYPEVKERTDTTLHITVKSPVYPDAEKSGTQLQELEDLIQGVDDDDDDDGTSGWPYKTKLIGNDTIGEKIFVVYFNAPEFVVTDSANFWSGRYSGNRLEDSTFIQKVNKKYVLPDGTRVRELYVTDTASSRMILLKSFYKNGKYYHLRALADTLSKSSALLQNFFASFMPADTAKNSSMYIRKTEQLFNDLFSGDSASIKKARRTLNMFKFDSSDVPLLKKAIMSLRWGMPDYIALKKRFIEELGMLKDTSITTYLHQLYWKIKDTADLQHAILNAVLSQRTKASFAIFKTLMLQEPPIMEDDSYEYGLDYRSSVGNRWTNSNRHELSPLYDGRWYDLYDTLSLTKTILPDFLQLLNVDDYREEVMNLMVVMVDSGYLKATDYESYYSKLYLDGKQQLKKQLSKEEKEAMLKATKKDKQSSPVILLNIDNDDDEEESDQGNEDLDKYAVLLLPFRDKMPGVQTFFDQLLKTRDRRLLYNTSMLLLRNNLPVADSVIMKYAALDKYRVELYKDLKKMKKPDRFPARYKNQLDIVKSMMMGGEQYEKMDTMVYLDKLPVTYKNRKGYVYFFKYKKMRDDLTWQLASAGMQPEKTDSIDIDNDDFIVMGDDRKLESDKPLKEQLEKMLKESLYSKRESAAEFYAARSYRLYKNYLSEMVKSRRYRD